MASLFEYTVEEQDGKLVISLQGQLPQQSLRRLREEIEAGSRIPTDMLLSPLHSIRALISSAVRLSPEPGGEEVEFDREKLTGQGIDQTLSEFETQIADFRRALSELKDSDNGADRAAAKPDPEPGRSSGAAKSSGGRGRASAAEEP